MRLDEDAYLDPKKFSANAIDLLSKLLAKDPKKRLGKFDDTVPFLKEDYGSDIMTHPWFKDIKWEKIRTKTHKAKIKPKIKNE